jgi:hypothetical protein
VATSSLAVNLCHHWLQKLGWAIEDHLQKIGMLKKKEIPEHQQKIMDEKRAEFEGAATAKEEPSDFPATAEVCKKCSVKAVIPYGWMHDLP